MMDRKNDVREDEIKKIYDRHYLEGYRKDISGYEFARWKALDHFIRRVLKLKNVATVLDYGGGSGLYINLWRQVVPGADLYFCDISSVALEQLRNQYPEYGPRCREVRENKAGFEDAFFDVIVSVEVMEHVVDLDGYLQDIFRLLKPGGRFIWTTPCANSFSIEHLYNVLTGQIEATSEGFQRWKENPDHLRRLKSAEIKDKLQGVGFNEVDFRFRAHFFSFVCTYLFRGPLRKIGERLMCLDYVFFSTLPNGASMLGCAKKAIH